MKIGVINSNTGNVENVKKSLKFLGYIPIMVEEKKQLFNLSHLIIPGVGSFPKMMEFFQKNNIDDVLMDQSGYNIKILGICLGMHIFFEDSEESHKTKGLNLIKGNVKKISLSNSNKTKRYVPNLGYHKIHKKFSTRKNNLFDKFNFENFYFSHSYKVCNYEIKGEIFEINYLKESILALIIKNKNLVGCQFHPELSGEKGLDFMDTFIKWND